MISFDNFYVVGLVMMNDMKMTIGKPAEIKRKLILVNQSFFRTYFNLKLFLTADICF